MTPEEREFFLRHREERPADVCLALQKRQPELAAFMARQIDGWQRLRAKVPSWAAVEDLLYPPQISLAQCSGEEAARYKAALARRVCTERRRMADLTGGLGVDFVAMAPLFVESLYIEQSDELSRLARHNFPLLGAGGAQVVNASCEDVLPSLPPLDLICLDPARRDRAGQKVVRIDDCTPNVLALMPQLLRRASHVLVKLSPMLDVHAALAQMPSAQEAHVVGSGGECKELLLLCTPSGSDLAADEVKIHVHSGHPLPDFAFSFREERDAQALFVPADAPDADLIGQTLCDAAAAVRKAGCFRWLSAHFGIRQLAPDAHLYLSDRPVTDFPGRTYRVADVFGFDKASLRRLHATVTSANLAVRGFPATAPHLQKRLRLADGGSDHLFATRLGTRNLLLLARPL